MIDFSQYPEEHPFIIENDFIINPFEEKRRRYIEILKDIENYLINYIERGIQGYVACNDNSLKTQYENEYNNAQELFIFLKNNHLWYFYDLSCPETELASCSCIEEVYYYFNEFDNYISQIDNLMSFEYEFFTPLEDSWEIVKQVFFKIGTPYQLYGYFDYKNNEIITKIEDFLNDIYPVEDTWTDVLTSISNNKDQLIFDMQQFFDDIKIAGQDIKSLIKPVYNYISLIKLGGILLSKSWGTFNLNDDLTFLLKDYSEVMVSIQNNEKEAVGKSLQITDNLINSMVKPDRSNLEMVMSKTTKISFNSDDIKQKLIDIHNTFIIPNYN